MNVDDFLKTIGVSQPTLFQVLEVEEDRKMLQDVPRWSVSELVSWANMNLGTLLQALGLEITEADLSGVQYDETTRWSHGYRPQM
jgi:hypothetical protein